MTAYASIARPYAQAAFDFAKEQDKLLDWEKMLAELKTIVQNHDVRHLITNPEYTWQQIADTIIAIAGKTLDKQGQNFIKILSKNDRLLAVEAIYQEYNYLHAAILQTIRIIVRTSTQLNQIEKKELCSKLNKRLQRHVELTFDVDPDLLGGAVLQIGDTVIDSSVRGQLARMKRDLIH